MLDRRKRVQFEQLFMPHLNATYNFARWLVRHPHDAEDLVQEAYLKAYRAFDQFKGGDAKAWLFTILRNTCLTWLSRQPKRGKVIDFNEATQRHDSRNMEPSLIATTPEPDEELHAEADRQRLHQALNELSEPYRMVLVLREFQDLKYSQIAEILDIPVGTVMSRLSRARIQLKHWLIDAADKEQKNEL